MEKEVLKYIQTEKEISKYNIKKLESCKVIGPTKRRILEIEKEFVSLPLEEMSFKDISEVAKAISIYRDSRSLFRKTYDIDKYKKDAAREIFNIVESKSLFLINIASELINKKVKEVNVVQDEDLYQEMSDSFENLDLQDKSLEELLKIEPIRISKKRARLQASLYSLGLYIDEHVRAYEFDENMSGDSLKEIELLLDFILFDAMSNVFKYYNLSLLALNEEMKGTMGENKYLGKLHGLKNLLNFNSLHRDATSLPRPIGSAGNFSVDSPHLSNLFYKNKDPNKSKVFGILFPIPRKGNEKMTLLYKDIFANKVPIGELFVDSISNVKAEDSDDDIKYFKAILMHPFPKMMGLSEDNKNLLKMIKKVSELKNNSIEIEERKGMILVPKTRSEEEGIAEIIPILKRKISEITEDYFKATSTTNDTD